jgi:hypothetical protein
MDYQGNSKNAKDKETAKSIPADGPKKIERIVATPVVVKKRGLGRKFKDLFIAADFKTTAVSVAMGVLVPAAKNMLLDAINKGSETIILGESATRRRTIGSNSRITYNSPPSRTGWGSPLRNAPPISPEPRQLAPRMASMDLILSTKEEADLVVENMNNVVDQYNVVSLADLKDMIGESTTHVDQKWGWMDLRGTKVIQVREGYLIDLPPVEAI